jgi:wyosine [tRNA(Phe)-imidazoG37] synthetase (radical SAM superfamily)
LKARVEHALSTRDHRRDAAGMTYVYPVLSRRSGGLSIGINLNQNNACNWRCIYCQVPNLRRGAATPVDVKLLGQELDDLLASTADGRNVRFEDGAIVTPGLRDIAISGNGEPTSCRELTQVMDTIVEVLARRSLQDTVKLVMITNGSLFGQPRVRASLARWGELKGEVWFKLDRATPAGLRTVNNARANIGKFAGRDALLPYLGPDLRVRG